MVVVLLVVCLALVGCQGGSGTVVLEKEMECTMSSTNGVDGTYLEDPELGKMERGEYNLFKMDCPDTYLDGNIYAILDTELHEDGTYLVYGWQEMVTKEEGVWKGMCETQITTEVAKGTCTYIGAGKYKGLKNDVTLNFEGDIIKTTIRVTRVPEK